MCFSNVSSQVEIEKVPAALLSGPFNARKRVKHGAADGRRARNPTLTSLHSLLAIPWVYSTQTVGLERERGVTATDR